MFAKIQNSWALIKASAAVLRADKELIIFPIVSSIALLIVTASFGLPMILTGFFDSLQEGSGQVLGVVLAFIFYVVQYVIIIFANSALVGAALIRLRGGDPTVKDGLDIAAKRFSTIMGYALIAATVGMILRWLSERGIVGQIASAIGGLAWNLATYLAVPVLVVEGVGPIEAIKRSAGLLKKTWGEQIVGNFGIGLVFGLLALAVVLVAIPIVVLAISAESVAVIVLVILIAVLAFMFLGLISSTLQGIYVAAVYRYAAEEQAGGFFSEEMVQQAFRQK
jgi:hypothetical protein